MFLALHPRTVVLLIGTNDFEQGASPETIAANTRLILASFRRHNSAMRVVLGSVFPSSVSQRLPAERIRSLNKILVPVAAENPHVIWPDVWATLADRDGDARWEEFPDLLHPNAWVTPNVPMRFGKRCRS